MSGMARRPQRRRMHVVAFHYSGLVLLLLVVVIGVTATATGTTGTTNPDDQDIVVIPPPATGLLSGYRAAQLKHRFRRAYINAENEADQVRVVRAYHRVLSMDTRRHLEMIHADVIGEQSGRHSGGHAPENGGPVLENVAEGDDGDAREGVAMDAEDDADDERFYDAGYFVDEDEFDDDGKRVTRDDDMPATPATHEDHTPDDNRQPFNDRENTLSSRASTRPKKPSFTDLQNAPIHFHQSHEDMPPSLSMRIVSAVSKRRRTVHPVHPVATTNQQSSDASTSSTLSSTSAASHSPMLTRPEIVERTLVLATIMNVTAWPEKPPLLTAPKLCESFHLVEDVHIRHTDSFFTVYRTTTDGSPASGHYVVAFRGVNMAKWRNYMTSLMLFPWPCRLVKRKGGCGWVHFGIYRAYKHLKGKLAALLPREGEHAVQKVSFTGHSLGGALSILAALDFKSRGYPVANCFVFGAPRVGNTRFEFVFHQIMHGVEQVRIVNRCSSTMDIITRMPSFLFSLPQRRSLGWIDYAMNDALDCSKLNGISLHERMRYLDGVETIAAAVALRSQCASIE